jgi:2-polyprenyl-3-methyl-5-hydroxy-6-metoxy-1,4-benzoquinol methylase
MKSLISSLLTIYKGLTEKEPYFKELVSDYEEYHTTSKMSTLSILRANLISECIEPYSSILDVGCGEGFLMEFLFRTKKCKVYGIDISKKGYRNCSIKGI